MNALKFVDAMVEMGFTAVDYDGHTYYWVEFEGGKHCVYSGYLGFVHIIHTIRLETDRVATVVIDFKQIGHTGTDAERKKTVKNLKNFLDTYPAS